MRIDHSGSMENVGLGGASASNIHRGAADREESRIDNMIRKLELPLFNREDPNRWIFRIERYFQFNQI